MVHKEYVVEALQAAAEKDWERFRTLINILSSHEKNEKYKKRLNSIKLEIENPEIPFTYKVIPEKGLEDFFGPAKRALLCNFISFYKNREKLNKHGLPYPQKLLFIGPPGNGKTLAAEILAKELGLPLYVLDYAALIKSFLGETLSNIQETLSNIQKFFDAVHGQRGIFLIDEIDSLLLERSRTDDVAEMKRAVTMT